MMYRRYKNAEAITLEYIDAKLDAKFDRFEEKWRQDRKEMEARLAADRKETADRLAVDRKEAEERQRTTEARLAAERKEAEERQKATEERLAAERKEAETRLAAERKEAQKALSTQKGWLIASFIAIIVGAFSITVAILTTNGYFLMPRAAESPAAYHNDHEQAQ